MKFRLLNSTLLLTILSFLMLVDQQAQAQYNATFDFSGTILIDDKKAKDVVVKAYEGNLCFSSYQTRSNGKFFFTAEGEKHYTLQFEKEGYVTKRVVIRTHNTKNLERDPRKYKFDLALVKATKEVNHEENDFPITIIELDKATKEFGFNKSYTTNRQSKNYLSSNHMVSQ